MFDFEMESLYVNQDQRQCCITLHMLCTIILEMIFHRILCNYASDKFNSIYWLWQGEIYLV